MVEAFSMLSNRSLGFNFKIANLHRAIANSPRVFRNWVGLTDALRNDTNLDPAERELAILCVLEMNDGEHELVPHRRLGEVAGLNPEQIASVCSPDAVCYNHRQRAILKFARAFANMPSGVPPDGDADICQYLDSRQRVELGLTLALYMGLAHFTAMLEVPPEAGI